MSQVSNIHTIITHPNPHLDEIVAIWLLTEYGEDLYPGISQAAIAFWNDVYERWNKQASEEQWLGQGFLLIGIGNGQFDEHAGNGNDQKNGDCAATLVAKHLGVDQDPELQTLLDYTLDTDSNQVKHRWGQMTWSVLIKRMHGRRPDPQIIDRVFEDIDDLQDEQNEFYSCSEDWPGEDGVLSIERGDLTCNVAFVESDRERMHAWVRHSFKDVDLVVIRRSIGHVHIFRCYHRDRPYVDMVRLTESIRRFELRRRGIESLPSVHSLQAAACDDVPEWYFPNHNMVLNGSKGHPEIRPTILSLDDLRGLISETLVLE